MRLGFEIEGDPARELLRGVNSLLNASAMRAYGRAIKRSTERRFEADFDVNGRPFTPLSEAYAKTKKGPNILVETGSLRSSLVVNARKGVADMGTPIVYGAYHQQQDGPTGGSLPQRQWLGVTDEDVTNVGDLAEQIWEAAFDA